MGIYDRDYYREPPPRGGFGHFSAWSVTTWLIVINVAVFFIDAILQRGRSRTIDPFDLGFTGDEDFAAVRRQIMFLVMGPLERWGYFSTDMAIGHGQVWRFVSFQFLHAGIGHLFGNMLGMFFFGPIVEAHFGARRYLAFYLVSGLAGAVFYLLLNTAGVVIGDPTTPLVGASAGVFGLLIAAALIAPDVEIYVYFFPVKVVVLAVVMMGVAAYTVVAMGHNAGGEAAHLGGGAMGFLLMRNQHWLHWVEPSRRGAGRAVGGPARKRRAFQKDWSKDPNR